VHAETYEADDKENKLPPGSSEFTHFNVDISLATVSDTDRMNGWSDEMKLNVIATHEKYHVSGGGELQDEDHKKGVTFAAEMQSAFEYSIMYLKTPLIDEPWLQNYNNHELIGHKKVNKAYKAAVEALFEAHKLTKKDGDKTIELTKTEADAMITKFTDANVPK
jgi:hypothetical protein